MVGSKIGLILLNFCWNGLAFGLTNAGATFQRAMYLTFVGKINKFIVIYLDLTMFSNSDEKHLKHLRKVFDRWRKFIISLNPKKSSFAIK